MNSVKIENFLKYDAELIRLLKQQTEDHLYSEQSTTNMRHKSAWRCAEFHPCKRTECSSCMERRRQYFVFMAKQYSIEVGLNRHATVTWPLSKSDDAWNRLQSLSKMLPQRVTGRIGPFIRVLAIGLKSDAPHTHYMIRSDSEDVFKKIIKKYSPHGSRVSLKTEFIYDVENLLNYLYEINFMPTASDPRRIKGMRLISGSRGKFTYSYPNSVQWKIYEQLLREFQCQGQLHN